MNKSELSTNEKINELLKLYVDAYLGRKNIIDSTTDLKNYGVDNEKGKIYANQVLTLQAIIQEELAVFGLDLAKLLEQRGVKFVPGTLSELEKAYINNKVNNILALLTKFEEFKASKNQ